MAFENKLAAVLNEKIPLGRAMNALAHMALGLGHVVPNPERLELIDYPDADGKSHKLVSKIPFIVLKANGTQLRKLREAALEKGIAAVDFPDTLIQDSWQEQLARTAQKNESELTYFGVCLFGPWEEVTELTRKFSLWR
ncbi:MAG: DUF2000 domain-containing protein [Candidatus Micrarchaeota archaeon]|nr:DUF2000 domain-containing protein [Candidatus Micrarchaeota archaeon]